MSGVSYFARMSSSEDQGSTVDRAIGGRIAWFMRSAGGKRRTQTELGEYLHLDQSAVSKKLRGERPFTIRELYAIAEWLERPIGSIVAEADQLGEPPVLVPRHRRSRTLVRTPSIGGWMGSTRRRVVSPAVNCLPTAA